MNKRIYKYLFSFVVFVLAVGFHAAVGAEANFGNHFHQNEGLDEATQFMPQVSIESASTDFTSFKKGISEITEEEEDIYTSKKLQNKSSVSIQDTKYTSFFKYSGLSNTKQSAKSIKSHSLYLMYEVFRI